ncbi:MAG: hypothetical protein QQW96_12200 [Tychonema bourrellyi B0820]|nr:hypothetical protein [Tychonema bourrellyi]MDQ2098395.1 hypothetical protein [Tychonema bourrellyi B0820]
MNREGAKDTKEEKEGNAVLPTLPFGNPYAERAFRVFVVRLTTNK